MKAFFGILLVSACFACTNFLITPNAAENGHPMVSYAADSASLYGALYHSPAATHAAGEMRTVIDWDSGVYLGEIPQAAETYNRIGNTNEFGLVIAESTWGGLAELGSQNGALIDYGSLIYIALERSKTAREAIHVMTSLVAEYGYASSGESFSIMDATEVWVLELIGKGNFEKGAVWVAQRVPDGYVTAHANQARITTFPRNDPENCFFSEDVVSFARAHGYYSGSDEDFSFSDTYSPITFSLARGCEARVWSFFRLVAGAELMDQYADYAQGYNLTNKMPWAVKPLNKLTNADIMAGMRDHYEGTVLDFTQDVGAGPYQAPYRWRPMGFESNGKTYTHERAISTMQTAWVFVAELRPEMPEPFRTILWFGVDDAATTVFHPFYGGATAIPVSHREDVATIMDFSLDSAFWVFSLVADMCYNRWSVIYPEVQEKQLALEQKYRKEVSDLDTQLMKLYEAGQVTEAVAIATKYGVNTGDELHQTWKEFWMYLFPRFLDGNRKIKVEGQKTPDVQWPGYPQAWFDRIAAETGDKYLVPDETLKANQKLNIPWHKIF